MQDTADRGGEVNTPGLDVAKLRALLPELGSAGLESAEAVQLARRGKVLKLKLGFNPNSSSVGTTVVVFLWSLVASGAVLAFTAAVLSTRFRRRRGLDAVTPSSDGDAHSETVP